MQPFSKVYDEWEEFWQKGSGPTPLGRYIHREKLRQIRRLLAGKDISDCIDVGCAMGHMLSLLLKITGSAVGIDISQTAVDRCRARGLLAFREDLLEHRNKYDLVFSDGLIEHFEDFRPFVAGLCRLSKRYVMIAQTDHSTLIVRILIKLENLFKPGVNVPEYPHLLSSFIEEFSRHSFRLLSRGSVLMGGYKVLLFKRIETYGDHA